jgi:uncharacterized protein YjbI with pentapeptide repeats
MSSKKSGVTGSEERDWIEILVAPLVIGVIATFLTAAFSFYQWKAQNAIEDRRAKSAQRIEEKRTNDAALQAYLDEMGNLILNRDLQGNPSKDVLDLARARTTTVIRRLDAEGNRDVTRFLSDSGLKDQDLLYFADLPGAKLKGAILPGANLGLAKLHKANLSNAFLLAADLRDANLSCTHVIQTPDFTKGANTICPPRSGADLSGAVLLSTKLRSADMRGVDLTDADLNRANLSRADLTNTVLEDANLQGANLQGAHLEDADLEDADLEDANLQKAQGITEEELAQESLNLQGAIMPNGQKYEDWLKDQEGHGKDNENPNAS